MFSCVLHTQKYKHATTHMRCAEYMHAQCSIHNAYISANFMHILGMYTAYILHTCTCYTWMLHACCTHNTSILHACCIHKNWLSTTRMPYKHIKKCMQFVRNCLHAACMLYINNCMYATHNNCTRVAYMYSDACDLMCMYVACVCR